MLKQTSSDSITNDIRVQVVPEFLGIRENNGVMENIFSYHITITNAGTITVNLQRRYWLIIDADGYHEEVEGEGVVGFTPLIEPNMSFSYTSMCPLKTDWGTMEGFFTMYDENSQKLKVQVNRFYLVHPKLMESSVIQ